MDEPHNLRDVGGTRGGLGLFVLGLAMVAAGGYLLTNQVSVYGGYWNFGFGYTSSFGLTLVPILFGVGFLFYNGKSPIGWLLLIVGSVILFAGILANMQIHFERTSLYNTLIMLVLLVGGLGLVLRSIRPMGSRAPSNSP